MSETDNWDRLSNVAPAMTPPRPGLPQAWRYTAERAAAFFSVLCLNWHEGHICTRPAGHKGKHRHSLRVAWHAASQTEEVKL